MRRWNRKGFRFEEKAGGKGMEKRGREAPPEGGRWFGVGEIARGAALGMRSTT
ncbi:hypothetical protein Cabys_1769 [Caldithrix abyssi DSM 13497]|uniref:Uncharacterized protein n=1 Tax=Caldithrix abyssi DSM 13497 TaxID=880073 RepID=A0A1J1C7H6_CALAY|nr:hypothetical protein Cabys_1769 [Caldithrix abyssi DSM 13497]